TVAERLVEILPNSFLFDAEEVGQFLNKVLGSIDQPDDFQHYPMWRSLVVTTAKLLRQSYDRDLIMPMTIWHLPYFDEVIGGLRRIEPSFYHFCLTASVVTIQERLRRRGTGPGTWTWDRAERCHAAFQSPL